MRTKRCTRCGQEKSLDLFYKTKNHSWCISCYRELNLRNYHKNPQRCMDSQRRRRKENPEINNSYRRRHPEKYKAHTAVGNAVRDGRLFKPSACEKCGKESNKLHGHHWHGYDDLHKLDVQWLCPMCHKSSELIFS